MRTDERERLEYLVYRINCDLDELLPEVDAMNQEIFNIALRCQQALIEEKAA